MRVAASSRRFLAAAVVATAIVWLVAVGSPALPEMGEGAKAAATDSETAPAVPGMTPWGALITGLLMLLSSSVALGYPGRRAPSPVPSVTTVDSVRTAVENPVRAKKASAPVVRRRPPADSRPVLHRQRTMVHPHSATSRSKKRRVGPGCRGPLRKT